MSTFWTKYKVLILSFLASLAVTIQQLNTPNPDIKVISYAVIMAALGAVVSFEKNAQGNVASIIGIVGTTLASIVPSLFEGQPIGWTQLIGSTVIAILAIINPGQIIPSPTPVPPLKMGAEMGSANNGFNNTGSIIVFLAILGLTAFAFFRFAKYESLELRGILSAVAVGAGAWIATMSSPYISNGKFWALVAIALAAIFIMLGIGSTAEFSSAV